jgi:hypothetical protein
MTREEAASDIKEKLIGLDREQLLAFIAAMDEGDTQELQEEAVELVNDTFASTEEDGGEPVADDDIEDAHSDIVGIIEEIKAESQGR